MSAIDDATTVLRLPRDGVQRALAPRIDLNDPVVAALFRRLHRSFGRQVTLAFESVRKRLARVLVRLARRDPQNRVYESDAALGALVGASRQTVNDRLERLRRKGYIDYPFRRHRITVPDPDRLERALERFK